MVKLIVSDIDGTLLPYGQTALRPTLFPVIRALRERGGFSAPPPGGSSTPCGGCLPRCRTS